MLHGLLLDLVVLELAFGAVVVVHADHRPAVGVNASLPDVLHLEVIHAHLSIAPLPLGYPRVDAVASLVSHVATTSHLAVLARAERTPGAVHRAAGCRRVFWKLAPLEPSISAMAIVTMDRQKGGYGHSLT